MSTPTPRTDAHIRANTGNGTQYVSADFARQLERDIAELNDRLIDRQKTLMAELVNNSSGNRNPCDWKQDDDGNWDTSCKQCMCFDYAPPFEQGYRFCHHCGKPIKFIEHEPEPPFEDFGGME